jgi:hypothetical protein
LCFLYLSLLAQGNYMNFRVLKSLRTRSASLLAAARAELTRSCGGGVGGAGSSPSDTSATLQESKNIPLKTNAEKRKSTTCK